MMLARRRVIIYVSLSAFFLLAIERLTDAVERETRDLDAAGRPAE